MYITERINDNYQRKGKGEGGGEEGGKEKGKGGY